MPWLLSSSGSRPLYLENIVRSLAMPPNTVIQYRYSESIVSDRFKAATADGTVVGQIAYLSYLDNRDKNRTPTIVPVRESKIVESVKRGSSYIIKLRVGRYIDHSKIADLQQYLRTMVSEDPLPDWGPNQNSSGYWAARLKAELKSEYLVPHDFAGATHLAAFESTARLVGQGLDFAGNDRLFANVIGIYDASGVPIAPSVTGTVTLNAGQTYHLKVYHYLDRHDSHLQWKPFWLSLASETSKLNFRTASIYEVGADYDEVDFVFSVDSDIEAPSLGLNLSLLAGDSLEKAHPVTTVRLEFKVQRAWWPKAAKFATVAIGLSLASLTALGSDKLTFGNATLVILGALLAAAGGGWKIKGNSD